MRTRHMNVRITFYKLVGGQNEDGEVLSPERQDLYTCWAEVRKNSIKDFREGVRENAYSGTRTQNIVEHKDEKIFLIRYVPQLPFDASCYIEFDGMQYKITGIERDYSYKDMDVISGVRKS